MPAARAPRSGLRSKAGDVIGERGAAMAKKTIAVVGATGAQGSGLVRAILADASGGFTARALTRSPQGDKAKALAAQGAEVVAADVDDTASLTRAFEGAHGVFCVTFFWDHFSPEKESAQARGMAQAAKDAGVAHAIWSTLEDTRERVPLYRHAHADAAGQVQGAALRRQGRVGPLVPRRWACRPPACCTTLLLGQPDPLRDGAQARAGRQARVHAADGRQEAARHRRRGHRRAAPTASSSAGAELDRQDASASRAST